MDLAQKPILREVYICYKSIYDWKKGDIYQVVSIDEVERERPHFAFSFDERQISLKQIVSRSQDNNFHGNHPYYQFPSHFHADFFYYFKPLTKLGRLIWT